MQSIRRASEKDARVPGSPSTNRHSSLVSDIEHKIQIENNMSRARMLSDAGFSSMDRMDGDDDNDDVTPKQSFSHREQLTSDYYSSMFTSSTDNFEDEVATMGGDMQTDEQISSQKSSVKMPGPDSDVTVGDVGPVKQGFSHESRKQNENYSSLAMSTPMHASGNGDYLELTGERETSTNGRYGRPLHLDDPGGSLQEQFGNTSVSLRRKSIPPGKDGGRSFRAALSQRVSITDNGTAGEPASQGSGLVTRVEVGDNQGIYSFAGDSRKGSGASILTLETNRSGSVDSAIDLTNYRTRAGTRSMQRLSVYETISENVATEEGEAESRFGAEGDQEVEVISATPDQPQQLPQLDRRENTYRPPAALQFVRCILRLLSPCIPRPRARPTRQEAVYDNRAFSAFSEAADVVAFSSSAERSPPPSASTQSPGPPQSPHKSPPVPSVSPRPDPCSSSAVQSPLPSASTQSPGPPQPPHKSPPAPLASPRPDPCSSSALQSPPPTASTQSPEPSQSSHKSPPAPSALPRPDLCFPKEKFLSAFDRTCSKRRDAGFEVVGRAVQIGNFAAAMLDSRGGSLSIDALDVHLYIPAGAIPESVSPRRVYIYVEGSLTNGHNYLTPYVHCGPKGFHFQKFVFLTLPHCAKDALHKQLTFEKSTSQEGGESTKELKNGIFVVAGDCLRLSVDHFCGIGARGEVDEKFMLVCPFIKLSCEAKSCEAKSCEAKEVVIHVRLLDNTKANLQEVESEERALDFVLGEVKQELVVKKTDRVVAKLSSKVDSWTITHPESCQQTIEPQYLLREYGPENVRAFPSQLFCARESSSSGTQRFKALLEVFPFDRSKDGVEFMMQEPPQPQKSTPPIDLDAWMCKEMAKDRFKDRGLHLNGDTFKKLYYMLDKPHALHKDWRILPEFLFGDANHGHEWVKEVEFKVHPPNSRTEYVLSEFVASRKNGKDTTSKLIEGLSIMSSVREDLEEIVDAIKRQSRKGDSQYYSSELEDIEVPITDI